MLNESNFKQVYSRFEESGLSVKDFCANEAIAPSTFYYWKKKHHRQSPSRNFIPLIIDQSGKNPAPFSDTPKKQDDNLFEVVFPNGTRLMIKNNIDLAQLKALIHLYD